MQDDIKASAAFDSSDISGITIERMPLSMVVTNPRLDDNPIVYVNRAFEKLTGYASDAAVGRNCRFLQGPETDKAVVKKLSRAIAERTETEVNLLNSFLLRRIFRTRILAWTVDDPHEATRLIHLGVRGIISNHPSRIKAVIRGGK